jgi:uncharacterized membrane protein
MAVCTKCGTSVPDDARFCPTCGSPIVQAEAPASVAEPMAQPTAEPIQAMQDQAAAEEHVQPQAPQQSYYAQPAQTAVPSAPQGYYAQPQQQQPQYYAQPGQQPQQSYYAQPAPGQQPPQQSYYAQQPPQQQSYYAQPGQQPPQQNYYAPQNQQPPQNYGYQQNYQQQPPSYQTGPADIAENKGISVLCYLGILLLIPLLSKPNSGFVRYHSNQGLVLLIFEILVGILGCIPYLGWFVIWPVGYIFGLVCLIMGIVNAVNGSVKPLPLIGKITLLK